MTLFVFYCLVCLLLLFYSCQLLLCVLSIMSQFNVHPYYVYCVFTTGNYFVLHHVIYRHTRCNGRKGMVKFELIYQQQALLVGVHFNNIYQGPVGKQINFLFTYFGRSPNRANSMAFQSLETCYSGPYSYK